MHQFSSVCGKQRCGWRSCAASFNSVHFSLDESSAHSRSSPPSSASCKGTRKTHSSMYLPGLREQVDQVLSMSKTTMYGSAPPLYFSVTLAVAQYGEPAPLGGRAVQEFGGRSRARAGEGNQQHRRGQALFRRLHYGRAHKQARSPKTQSALTIKLVVVQAASFPRGTVACPCLARGFACVGHRGSPHTVWYCTRCLHWIHESRKEKLERMTCR